MVDAVNGTTPPPTGGTLTNGVAVTGLSARDRRSLNYTMAVPAGATNLKFVIAGGTGDLDMYVKFGSAPTDYVLRLPSVRERQRRDLQHRHRAGRHVLRAA